MRKILILGRSAQVYSLAKYLSSRSEVFVYPGNSVINEFTTTVKIENYSSAGIAEFVKNNEISITIPVDIEFATKELANIFEENKLQLFAPALNASSFFNDKIGIKKLLYKLHIPIPRFASFDKASAAYDYIKSAKFPIIIKSKLKESAAICVNEKIAKAVIDDLVFKNETILIEEFIYGKTFSIYFISDGYKALPLGTALNYNFSLDGDGGVLTNGLGALSPFYKLTDAGIDYLTTSAANSFIEYFEQQGTPFIGIFGFECILTDDERLIITNSKYFLSDTDAPGLLALLDIDLVKVINDCLEGLFADMYDYIPQKDCNALSLVISAKHDGDIIEGVKNLAEDTILTMYPLEKNKYLEYETVKGKNVILTTLAGTIARARETLYTEVKELNFKSITYRKDIGAILAENRGLV